MVIVYKVQKNGVKYTNQNKYQIWFKKTINMFLMAKTSKQNEFLALIAYNCSFSKQI